MLKCKAITALLGECGVPLPTQRRFWGIKSLSGTSDDQPENLKTGKHFFLEDLREAWQAWTPPPPRQMALFHHYHLDKLYVCVGRW